MNTYIGYWNFIKYIEFIVSMIKTENCRAVYKALSVV